MLYSMVVEVLRAKIHRVSVTNANLHYIGSIGLDPNLIEAAGMLENERVQVLNIDNGERFDTYVMKGTRHSGEVSLNGPAARRVQLGDTIIIVAYGFLPLEEAQSHQPTVIFPENNQVR